MNAKVFILSVWLFCSSFSCFGQLSDLVFSSFDRDTLPNGVVVTYDEPYAIPTYKPLKLVLYALPNGSTMEKGYGKIAQKDDPPVFESQHIGAQTVILRNLDTAHTYVVVYIENELKSWPAWVKAQEKYQPQQQIADILEHIQRKYAAWKPEIALTAHSGGGRFMFTYLESQAAIPQVIKRMVFLDANYGYEKDLHHLKLQKWLENSENFLQVIAYNDSVVVYQGKPLVSPTGGTWYRSKRMINDLNLFQSKIDGLVEYYHSSQRNAEIILINNPEGKIFHSVLVEKNGFIHSVLQQTPLFNPKWFWKDRIYQEYILKDLPKRDSNYNSGSDLASRWIEMDSDSLKIIREHEMESEVKKGNFPDFMRQLVRIEVPLESHPTQDSSESPVKTASYWVMPDYLMVGDDSDFIRLPMRPQTAQRIADHFGFFLSTAKVADDIYQHAKVKLEPQPLTEEREAFATFIQHQRLIETQRNGRLGLIAGIKKDVISTPKLFQTERPNRVALYGWHKLDGLPIQPIYTGHVDHYVDYSHGFRLIWDYILINNKFLHYSIVLQDPELRQILTNEGNEKHFKY